MKKLAIILVLTGSFSAHAGNLFNICNQTQKKVYVARAWWSGEEAPGHVITEGWLNLEPGQCAKIFDEADTFDYHRYYYAEQVEEGGAVWSDDKGSPWCVNSTDVFHYVNNYPAECPEGFELKQFRHYPDSDLNLTE